MPYLISLTITKFCVWSWPPFSWHSFTGIVTQTYSLLRKNQPRLPLNRGIGKDRKPRPQLSQTVMVNSLIAISSAQDKCSKVSHLKMDLWNQPFKSLIWISSLPSCNSRNRSKKSKMLLLASFHPPDGRRIIHQTSRGTENHKAQLAHRKSSRSTVLNELLNFEWKSWYQLETPCAVMIKFCRQNVSTFAVLNQGMGLCYL